MTSYFSRRKFFWSSGIAGVLVNCDQIDVTNYAFYFAFNRKKHNTIKKRNTNFKTGKY